MVLRNETAELVAPATLGAGYRLVAEVNGVIKTVVVPDGGVIKGQWFVADIEQSSKPLNLGTSFNRKTAPKAVGDGNPTGRWRDGLCDCCVLGVCHSMCCMSCFCGPVALGQVMTRMSRGCCGGAGNPRDINNTCRVVTFLFATYIVLMIILYCIVKGNITSADDHGISEYKTVVACLSIINIAFWGYIMIATARTRRIIRKTYKIRTSMPCDDDCGSDDFCCSVCCFVCTVGQMARHTNDYDVYPVDHCSGVCFNKTGQSAAAPVIEV